LNYAEILAKNIKPAAVLQIFRQKIQILR